MKKHKINDEINASMVMLVNVDGVTTKESIVSALAAAREAGLDLVEIDPRPEMPVCKILDYDKYSYAGKKSKKSSKQKKSKTVVKEMKFRPVTDVGDFNVKMRKIVAFLESGHRVKVSIVFRGREVHYNDRGLEILERIKQALYEIANIEYEGKLEGRQIQALFSPKNKNS